MIVIGTGNSNKAIEVAALPAAVGLELVPAASFGDAPEIVEDGTTFQDNAIIKARAYADWLRREFQIHPLVIAEDSGLMVAELGGWPGVQSARIAPENPDRIQQVLDRLEGRENRRACFKAVTAAVEDGKLLGTWEGAVEGVIAASPRGEDGFGYDPVFEIPRFGKTFAELGRDMKNSMSHRTLAWQNTFNQLRALGVLPDRRALSRDVEVI